jgi:UDP-N-acetylglucosamine 2-epimerase
LSDPAMVTRVAVVIGTRPEAIKLAPLVRALKARRDIETIVCSTGQHGRLLDQMLAFFRLEVDVDLKLMQADQSPAELAGRTLVALHSFLKEWRPDWLVVQGDTSTAAAAALCGFYNRCRIAHVEAGLRTNDRLSPFPEEMNRRLITAMADMHFAPTKTAQSALLGEGVVASSVILTGNTGIDALFWTLNELDAGRLELGLPAGPDWSSRIVLVTAHRRENFGGGMDRIASALRTLAERIPDIEIVLPVHPNPQVERVIRTLSDAARIHLCEPLEYGALVWLLKKATLILTDSGGIQEEATALGKPMLIMRDTTERPEAIATGNAVLVGTDVERIVGEAVDVLTNADVLRERSRASTVFGDGHAAERIVAALLEDSARQRSS